MSCISKTISGLAHDCSSNIGGISKVWITGYKEGAATLDKDIINGFNEAVTLESWKPFAFRKGAASMTKTANIDAANGINYITTELVINFSRMETTKRIEMQALLLDEVMVIVKDNNGVYWFLGYDEPVNATAGGGQTGQAKTDANQYTITLTDESHELPYEVSKTFGETLTKELVKAPVNGPGK